MKLTKYCFAITGLGYHPPWIVNSGFVTGSEKTLVIDSGPNYFSAQTIYGYAKNVKPENELLLINTEKHLDHIGGNCYFAEKNVKIIGHKEIKRLESDIEGDIKDFNKSIISKIRRDANEEKIFYEKTILVNPSIHVKDGEVISLGNLDITVYHTPGHTSTNVSVYAPDEKVLYCGDCITNKYIPNLEAGDREDWKLWLNSLEKLSSLNIEFIVPGHGQVVTRDNMNKEFDRVRTVLEKAISTGVAPTIET